MTADGRVFHELTGAPGQGGYTTLKVPTGNRPVTIRRHTLVLETFKGPANGRLARHLDGNPANDNKSNLRWGTPKENGDDTIRHGRTTRGTKNAQAKLTAAVVMDIRRRRKAGESGSALAIEYGVSQSSICDITARRTWAHLKEAA